MFIRERKVKCLLGVAALLAAVTVQAAELSKDTLCESWARNATIGGEHALLGHARQLVPMSQEAIIELIEHGTLLEVDGIPVFIEDHERPEVEAFLKDSVFYGFDYVKRMPKEQIPHSATQMLEVFAQACLSREQV